MTQKTQPINDDQLARSIMWERMLSNAGKSLDPKPQTRGGARVIIKPRGEEHAYNRFKL